MKWLVSLLLSFSAAAQNPFMFAPFMAASTSAPPTGQAFSDDFNRANNDSLGGNWTEQSGDMDIVSNTLENQSESFACDLVIYSGQALNTVNGYICTTLTLNDGASEYVEYVFRYTDASSAYYTVEFQNSENVVTWNRFPTACGTASQIASSALTIASGDKFGITWTGTGTSTVVRVWKNPTANTPISVGEWDSGDTNPDVEFTTDPGTPVNTGTYVGLGNYTAAIGNTRFDNFFAGDK